MTKLLYAEEYDLYFWDLQIGMLDLSETHETAEIDGQTYHIPKNGSLEIIEENASKCDSLTGQIPAK